MILYLFDYFTKKCPCTCTGGVISYLWFSGFSGLLFIIDYSYHRKYTWLEACCRIVWYTQYYVLYDFYANIHVLINFFFLWFLTWCMSIEILLLCIIRCTQAEKQKCQGLATGKNSSISQWINKCINTQEIIC
jgi:hypothetical protein